MVIGPLIMHMLYYLSYGQKSACLHDPTPHPRGLYIIEELVSSRRGPCVYIVQSEIC
jgi:hypothetical protein